MNKQEAMTETSLTIHQRLPTSGARAVLPFEINGGLYLAIPQLAEDIPGQAPQMNAGNSDIDMALYRWRDGKFGGVGRLPVAGGEDVEFFSIGSDCFLATASIRAGRGPYDFNVDSQIFKWSNGTWAPFQSVPTFAAKQWRHFSFDGRHFLALAQGVTVPGPEVRHPRTSRIFEWDGARFAEFQVLDGAWGYNWEFFERADGRFLAYADHVGQSRLHKWDGARFAPFQDFADHGGRAFRYFEADGSGWMAFAAIDGESVLYRWADGAFRRHQSLGGPGGREFAPIKTGKDLYLVRVCFIEGTPAAPKVDLQSQLYRWQTGQFAVVQEFPTFGGTDAHAFTADGGVFLAVSNSLSREIRFREDTIIYRFAP